MVVPDGELLGRLIVRCLGIGQWILYCCVTGEVASTSFILLPLFVGEEPELVLLPSDICNVSCDSWQLYFKL